MVRLRVRISDWLRTRAGFRVAIIGLGIGLFLRIMLGLGLE